MTYDDLQTFLATNWIWAATAAGTFGVLTKLADKLLKADQKETIALWLMGADSEENWARSFCALFDSVFGPNHLSMRCVLTSCVASLVAMVGIWMLLSEAKLLETRVKAELSLGELLILGITINLLADYLSLLETRLLLEKLKKNCSFLFQCSILLIDLAFTSSIIFATIWIYFHSPLYEGETQEFSEILGLFSIFSVFFYSTFLTSVWTWGYITSSWLMRVFVKTKLSSQIELKNAMNWFAVTGSFCVGVVAFAVATPFQESEGGLSHMDKALCSVFPGQVCNRIAELTVDEQAQLRLVLTACRGGVTEKCVSDAWEMVGTSFETGLAPFDLAGEQKTYQLLLASCEGGDVSGCEFLESMGFGANPDLDQTIAFLEPICDLGHAEMCYSLGVLHASRAFDVASYQSALKAYGEACELGEPAACRNADELRSR
ncbi:sel1 repeat family protein [Shimia ponticola]|uniref:sel1 repeat family protein n=1 Tax=Shimia ponticola TaxID=2582893 RepID=UPI0011BE2BAA|nr:sel1 repeat family protein [Shimia ponticola]